MMPLKTIARLRTPPQVVRWLTFCFVAFCWLTAGLLCSCSWCAAQDIVTVQGTTGKIVKRKGQISAWRGTTMTLNINGRDKTIDQSEIIQYQTAWTADCLAGQKQLLAKDYDGAIENFTAALSSERRDWAVAIIRSQLIQCYTANEDWPAASKQFLSLLRDDPQTRFMNLMPIPWAAGLQAANMEPTGNAWAKSEIPAVQLMGASWLLGGKSRDSGIAKLTELTKDLDPSISALAQAQLWRVRTVTATPVDLKIWGNKIKEHPEELRAGAYLVLADAQARLGKAEEAKINLMRIPILYTDQPALAAAALYRCGNLFNNEKRTEEAKAIWDELERSYPKSFWARQLENRFDLGG